MYCFCSYLVFISEYYNYLYKTVISAASLGTRFLLITNVDAKGNATNHSYIAGVQLSQEMKKL